MRLTLVITRGTEYGGAQFHVLYLAKYLRKKGIDVNVIVGSIGPISDLLLSQKISIVHIPTLVRKISLIKDLMTVIYLTRYFKRHQYDLVAAHSSKAGLLSAISCRLAGTPFIFTAHSWPFLQGHTASSNTLYKCMCRIICGLAKKVICVCNHDRNIAVQMKLDQPAKFSVIHNGIPDRLSSPRIPPTSQPENYTKVAMISRLNHPKNPELLIRAVARVSNLELTIVGDGPQRTMLDNMTHSLEIDHRVIFVGEADEPSELIENSDIVALISYSEGLPLAILEGMRAGLPILATNVGGIPEIITDGEEGFLVPPDDVQQLTNRLHKLAVDQSLRITMGAKSRKRYIELFQVDTMINRTLDIYLSSIQQATNLT